MKVETLPIIEDIKKYIKKWNLLPIYVEISSWIWTAVNCLEKLINEKVEYPFLLESLDNASNTSRYTIIWFNPIKTFLFKDEKTCLIKDTYKNEENIVEYLSPFDILKAEIKKYKSIKNENLPPLTSWLIWYFWYDNINSLYKIPKHKNISQEYPYWFFWMYEKFVVFDNYKQWKIQIISNVYIEEDMSNEEFKIKIEKANQDIVKILNIISKSAKNEPLVLNSTKNIDLDIKSNLTNDDFKNILNNLKKDLTVWDVFQTIISEVYSFDLNNIKSSKEILWIDIYKWLRHVNPASYMFYFYLKEFELIWSVPETFVRINWKNVLTRPLAWTRWVWKNLSEFKKLKHELQNDPKERAEHAMLIDLIRNDLSKNCEPWSIKVKKKMYIKKYNHVMHIVSDVVWKIAKEKDFFDVFSWIFPHWNVTWAPKIKAMKLINEYEPTNRWIYGWAIWYFWFNWNADFAVIIRTIIKKWSMLYNQVWSGIVIDFIAEKEIKEHKNKNKTFVEILKLLRNNF